jgi:hypothetical protein
MAYNKITNFTAKDGLTSGDPAKLVKGTEIDNEFQAIEDELSKTNISAGKTLSVTKTLTLAGTDGTTMTFPGVTGDVATENNANAFTANQSITLNDTTDALTVTQTGTGNALLIQDSSNPDATPFVIDAVGRTIAGHPSWETEWYTHTTAPKHVSVGKSPNAKGYAAINYGGSSCIMLARSNGANIGDRGTVAQGDNLGQTVFAGDDGSSGGYVKSALIKVEVDGTVSAGTVPSRMLFNVMPVGSTLVYPEEAMRISNDKSVTMAGDLSVTGNITGTLTNPYNDNTSDGYQVFTSGTQTWTKPSWVTDSHLIRVQVWGSGGGGANAYQHSGGGGGGGYMEKTFRASELRATERLTVSGASAVNASGGYSRFGVSAVGISTHFRVNMIGGYTHGSTSIVVDEGVGTLSVGDQVAFEGYDELYTITTGTTGAGTIVISPGYRGWSGSSAVSLPDNTRVIWKPKLIAYGGGAGGNVQGGQGGSGRGSGVNGTGALPLYGLSSLDEGGWTKSFVNTSTSPLEHPHTRQNGGWGGGAGQDGYIYYSDENQKLSAAIYGGGGGGRASNWANDPIHPGGCSVFGGNGGKYLSTEAQAPAGGGPAHAGGARGEVRVTIYIG